MKANLASFLVVALLVLCGWWLADSIAQMRKNQDCALSGRRNCTPIDVPVKARQQPTSLWPAAGVLANS